MSWTDERIELLKKLWSEGLSASTIAAEMGGVTRNAVIGKVHRLGLSGRVKPASAAGHKIKPTRTPTHPLRSNFFIRGNTALAVDASAVVALRPVREVRPMEDVVVALSERVTIMDLRDQMCRWPLGDPGREEFRFCGAHSQSGCPYCAHHAAIAYQPVIDRRREKRTVRG